MKRWWAVISVSAAAGLVNAQTEMPTPDWGTERLAVSIKDKNVAIAVAAAEALAKIPDEEAFQVLALSVTDDSVNRDARIAAIKGLRERGDARATSHLLGALGDKEVGESAAETLAYFPSDELTQNLIRVLREDKRPARRADAAFALGRLRDERAVQPLAQAIRDPAVEVRVSACAALARLGDAGAVQPLIVNLGTDNDWRGRLAAAEALACFHDPRAVRPLCDRLDDNRAEVRAAAARALAALGDVAAIDPLRTKMKTEKNENARAAMSQALEKLKNDVLKGTKIR